MISVVTTIPATDEDADQLARIRVDAMRPSLEAVGRFDPERARRRFLDTFSPDDTRVIKSDGAIAGFYVVRRRADHLYLDHLYLRPDQQGKGVGRLIIEQIKGEARRLSLPIRLMAFKESAANAFYRNSGFHFVGAESFDNHYEWSP